MEKSPERWPPPFYLKVAAAGEQLQRESDVTVMSE